MDKFGIFSVLNSFFNFYEKNKGDFEQFKSGKTASEKENSSQTSTTSPPNANASKTNEKVITANAPLQQGMIKTMCSHDEFVKRVQNRNNLNTPR